MARRDAYLETLASVPLLSACSKRELQRVARAVDEETILAGRILMEQGETGRECFFVISGTASVKRSGRRVGQLGPGDTIGELALLDHGPRTATVVADTEMDILVLSARDFASVIDDVPSIARKLLGYLASRVRELDAKAFG